MRTYLYLIFSLVIVCTSCGDDALPKKNTTLQELNYGLKFFDPMALNMRLHMNSCQWQC